MTNIGDTIRTDDLTVPLGTVMREGSTDWVREVDGWHRTDGGRHYSTPSSVQLNGDVTALWPFTETIDQHKQRFAVTCMTMGSIMGGGGYLEGARDIVRNLSLVRPDREPLRLGSWVNRYVNIALAPVGTLLLSGSPEREEGHSLFAVRPSQQFEILWGSRRDPASLLLRVVAFPEGHTAEAWPEPSEDDAEQIRLFRIASWDAAYQVKIDRGWCPDFERAISVLSLSRNMADLLRREADPAIGVAGFTGQVGEVVGTQVALAAAPIGTEVEERGSSWWAVKRDDGQWWARNEGVQHGIFLSDNVRWRSIGTQGLFGYGVSVDNAQQRSCPLGAVFAFDHDTHDRYYWGSADVGDTNGTRGLTDRDAQWSNTRTTVVWDGVSPIHEVPVKDHRELELMPVGTVIGQSWNTDRFAVTWVKRSDGMWMAYSDGGYVNMRTAQFSIEPLRYAYIPVPGVPMPSDAPVPAGARHDAQPF